MSVYHQMGNDSANLVFEPRLPDFSGAILSPVNCDKDGTQKYITRMREKTGFEVIFDPQLYFPQSEMGCLPTWDYFPKDVATADPTNFSWWQGVIDGLVESMASLQPDYVCSPAMVPRTFPDAYYEDVVRASDYLSAKLAGKSGVLTTVIADMADLTQATRALAISSIVSRSKTDRAFLVFKSDIEPRRELASPEELIGAMKLIRLLENSGISVLIGFCSTDVVLWKHAGATSCATGKFFNLRRFTLKRFAEPSSGGAQLPYWCEESLLAFIRQSDLIRLQQRGLVSDSSSRNPFGTEATEKFGQNKPWIASSWRQFLWWFSDVEQRLNFGQVSAGELVTTADQNWAVLERTPKLFLEERANDGSWIRQWLRAIEELG